MTLSADLGEACKECTPTIFTIPTIHKPPDPDQACRVYGTAFEMVLVQEGATSMDATILKVPAPLSAKLSSLVGIEVTATENENEEG